MRIKMPAVRIAQADADSAAEGGGSPTGIPADTLTCGACRKAFALADIVRFIQHKVSSCDKDLTSYHCYSGGPNSDQEDGSRPGQIATGNSSGRRPSLLTARRPPSSRVHTPPLVSPSIAPPDLLEDGGASSTPKRLLDEADVGVSTPKRRASTSPMPSSSPDVDIKPKIKQEHMDTTSSPEDHLKKSRTEVVDAESNTMHSEPSNYVCSTCKARVHSAWRLVQHVQHVHGVKIYVESMQPQLPNKQNHSSSSTSSSSSGCSSTGASLPPPTLRHHPLLPPPDMHSPFGVGGLLRMPLPGSLPPLAHPSVPPTPLFARPNHHDHRFRMEQLVSEQFRHHGLNLAAAAAAVAANSLPPHQAYPSPADRPSIVPTSLTGRERPPVSQPLSLEPQLDFYSQRLRQLAGTTSPGAATGNSSSPSPRKHSPPFASPSPSRVGQTPPVGAGPGTVDTPREAIRAHSSISPEHRIEPQTADAPPPERPSSTPPAKRNNDEAIHTCEFCGKKFRFENSLISHRRIHTGEKRFKCNQCDATFEKNSKLKKHMKAHRAADGNTEELESGGDTGEDDSEDDLEDEELDGEEEEENEDGEDVEEAEDLTVSNHSAPSAPPRKQTPAIPAHPPTASVVGELMDKFGLSNIAQYSEAFKQALQESGNTLKWQLAKDRDNNNGPPSDKPNGMPPTAALRLKEEFAKLPPQPHPLFNPFENPFEASKRMKLDMDRGEGWWLPTLHAQRPPDNIFDGLKNSSNGLLQNPLLKSKDGRRNDTCEFCGKVFKNCSNLTVHRRSHTGEKPYKCELCSYACAQSSKLTRHMKTHGRLGKDVYRCRFCEMPFSVPSTLEKHMRKCVVNQSNGASLALSDDSNACRDEAS